MQYDLNVRHQEAIREWIDISKWNNPYAVTLTLKKSIPSFIQDRPVRPRISKTVASDNFKRFLNILNGMVFRKSAKRYNKRIKVVGVMERTDTKHLHYHAVIDCPKEFKGNDFEATIKEAWAKTLWAHEQVHVKSNIDQGWIRYITKLRDKYSVTDAVDWINVTL